MDMNNVLYSVKDGVGGEVFTEAASAFDNNLIMYINNVFTILNQLGVPLLKKSITKETTWTEAVDHIEDLESVKTYVIAKVKYNFDPPTGTAMQALEELIKETEWRIVVDLETVHRFVET